MQPVIGASDGTVACAGIGLADAVLHGDPTDPALAWLVNASDSSRIDLVWLPGYVATFEPRLEVVDPSGAVVMREGDQIAGGCLTGRHGVLLLGPPFEVGTPNPHEVGSTRAPDTGP